MKEVKTQIRTFTLTELGESLQSVIDGAYKKTYWVKAEIVKLNYYPKSGHCYPDLVDKENNRIKSQFRGILWGKDYQRIQKDFKEKCQSDLKSGMKVLLKVKVQYHSLHGLSLHILDIDANFTIGEMALNRVVAIKKLKAEGVYSANKTLDFPVLPKRMAIISVETSKGYQDFMNILKSKPYSIETSLFPALLQGDIAVKSIRQQLINLKERGDYFDAVAIIRGGGGEIGLDCYDAYTLAKEVATLGIPVLAGIGHAANTTVVEMVSYQHFITPTDLAYYVVGKFDDQNEILKDLQDELKQNTHNYLIDEKEELSYLSVKIKDNWKNRLGKEQNKLNALSFEFKDFAKKHLWEEKYVLSKLKQDLNINAHQQIKEESRFVENLSNVFKSELSSYFKSQKQELENSQLKLEYLDPVNILKRGYSLQYNSDGDIIMSKKDLKKGDKLITKFNDGNVESTIDKID